MGAKILTVKKFTAIMNDVIKTMQDYATARECDRNKNILFTWNYLINIKDLTA